ncbi:Os01g0784400 [Oryza sativa Japonica Group]|jgi:hypothetical protein|uniref:Os01g0784400 protein n=1 Tax=Oryza sativa subsp. japonica TaxID=39947 RepID=A0A0P0V8Z5_ORYSJ|nr:Os01g0784400 [Oryza sativa Japonica Group]
MMLVMTRRLGDPTSGAIAGSRRSCPPGLPPPPSTTTTGCFSTAGHSNGRRLASHGVDVVLGSGCGGAGLADGRCPTSTSPAAPSSAEAMAATGAPTPPFSSPFSSMSRAAPSSASASRASP